MYALLAALDSYGDERLAAIHDALAIRAARHQQRTQFELYSEFAFEISEGTAQYTEYRLNLSMYETIADIRQRVDQSIGKSFGWLTFGYYGGAMYSLLLSELDVNWKNGLLYSTDFGGLLMSAAGITELRPLEEIDLSVYNYEKIIEAEQVWLNTRERIYTNATAIFDSGEPVLQIPFGGNIPFEILDQLLIPAGLVWSGTFVLSGIFGELNITEGYLLSGMYFSICAVGLETDGRRATGSYWELTLRDDFEIVRDTNILGRPLDNYVIRLIE
jgi:hypothetical protein